MTNPIAAIFDSWEDHRAEYGIADYLRCCAMEALDEGLSRQVYLGEAEKRGYNKSTAATCWAFVRRQ